MSTDADTHPTTLYMLRSPHFHLLLLIFLRQGRLREGRLRQGRLLRTAEAGRTAAHILKKSRKYGLIKQSLYILKKQPETRKKED
jgi:hypothetical protein